MAERPHWFLDQPDQVQSSSNSTWATAATGTFEAGDQDADATYVVFWNTTIWNTSSANRNYEIEVRVDGTPVNANSGASKDARDRHQAGGFFFFDAGSSPADVDFSIHIKPEFNSHQINATNSRIAVIKLTEDDEYVESLSAAS